jgi:hypothetical protein
VCYSLEITVSKDHAEHYFEKNFCSKAVVCELFLKYCQISHLSRLSDARNVSCPSALNFC